MALEKPHPNQSVLERIHLEMAKQTSTLQRIEKLLRELVQKEAN